MNTHQKVFFSCAVSLGLVAAAFATPAASPVAAPAAQVKVVETIELARATVIGHRTVAPEITLDHALVLGHRSDSMVASHTVKYRLIA